MHVSEQTNGQFLTTLNSETSAALTASLLSMKTFPGLQQSWSFAIPPALGPLPGAQGMSQIFLPCGCGDLSNPMVRVTVHGLLVGFQH